MKLIKAIRPARQGLSKSGVVVGGAVLAAAAVAVANQRLARLAERRHPPRGQIIEVDGVPIHYFEAGAGEPVLLIHGNGVTAEDWVISGLFERLAATHRVIALDRPGFGYSARPRNRIWTATAQARLIGGTLDRLGVGRLTVIAHSWGTLVALRLALLRPDLVAALGLLSGYYWPTPRLDVPMMSGPAIPGLGDVLRFTLSPLLGWLSAPLVFRRVFSPSAVTPDFKRDFPTSMALRPSQIRASAADTAMMPLEALGVSKHYSELTCPVALIAGDGDKVASFKHQSARLTRETGWPLATVKGAGHMVHHIAPQEVAAALEALLARAETSVGPAAMLRAERQGARS
jgi:pimeloyl-ACP methyl ester carboxylesterase